MKQLPKSNGFEKTECVGAIFKVYKSSISANGWVFVSGFALHNAQFRRQMLMAKLAQIPCYKQCDVYR